MSAWKTGLQYADVILPVAPFTETSGTFVNTEGRVQSFFATVHPLGEARPAWKVLRVLGSLLGRPGFEFDNVEQVRAACIGGRDIASLLSNRIGATTTSVSVAQGIQRIADVPIYFADPLARRSPPLQKTPDARPPRAWMNSRLMARLGVSAGQEVLVNSKSRLKAALDDKLPDDCVRIAAAHPSTAGLGPMFGSLKLEPVAVGRAA
jgi:NADH-quinone oxidoreductase subunit G